MHLHDSFVTLTVPQLAVFLPLKMRFNCPVHVFFCTSHAPFLFPTIANGSAICFIFGTVSSWHPCPRGSLATLWGDRCIDPEGSNWSLNFLNLHTILHKSFFGSEYHRTTGSYLVLLGPIKKGTQVWPMLQCPRFELIVDGLQRMVELCSCGPVGIDTAGKVSLVFHRSETKARRSSENCQHQPECNKISSRKMIQLKYV